MNEEKLNITEEIRIIPWWAAGLAIVLFGGVQALLHLVLFPREPNPPPVAFRVFVGLMAGCVLAFFVLLVGYVNRDAKRRGMNTALWTVLVIFVPNAIGFIIYFFLRQPLLLHCSQCGVSVSARYNFCPNCRHNVRPYCPQCKHEIRVGDKYCPYCAYELAAGAG